MKYSIILTTTDSKSEAQNIAKALIEKRVAACVQIEQIESIYRWEGKITQEGEYLLRIKSTIDRYPQIESIIKKMHSYDIPQIIQIPITDGYEEYLKWIDKEVEKESIYG